MATTTFEQKFSLIKKWTNRVILPLGAGLLVLSFLVEWFSAFFGWALIIFVGIICIAACKFQTAFYFFQCDFII